MTTFRRFFPKQRLSPKGGAGRGLLLLLLFALTLTGCNTDDPAIEDPNVGDITNGITKSPDWTYTPNAENYQTMTVILRLPDTLKAYADATDQLTALAADGKVCGYSEMEINDPDNMHSLYYLTIGAPACESKEVSIAYYSAKAHRIYRFADKITFAPDEIIGTYTSPFVPTLK
ncbi:MAG: hypothetical protein MJZ54_07170 [Bacteroidaceae bacterium]|nr:hypothetical protein [Bacteroidaceae bacterium]